MIIYGLRAPNIGQFELNTTTCDHCGSQDQETVAVFGRYFHVYWIPFLPLGMTATAVCTHCQKATDKNKFSIEQREAYERIKMQIKRPAWHWLGLGLIALPFAIGLTQSLYSLVV